MDMHKFILNSETLPIVEQMAEQMPGGFFIYRENENRDLIYVNHVMLDLFGCDTLEEFKELTGYTFNGLVYPEDFPIIQESIDAQINHSNRNLDHVIYRIRRKDGKIRWVDDYGRFSHSEEFGDVYYVFLGDITDQKNAEEAQRVFLFNISHDLYTPMNAISGFMELAEKHLDDPGKAADCLQKAEASMGHLLHLVSDLIALSDLSTGHIVLRPVVCSLKHETEVVVDMFRHQAEDAGLQVSVDIPERMVMLDAMIYRRIMSNLIGNAIKFTPAGGRVDITATELHVSSSGYVRYEIRVADNGIGISKDFLPKLFLPFEREQTSTESGHAGTGVGLAIVKELLDLVGGSISVETEKGKGSTFILHAAIKQADIHENHSQQDPSKKYHDDGSHRLLVVDDVELNLMLMEMILTDAGYMVELLSDGCDAVEAVRKHPTGYYSAILMDIQMPVMNGYEATRAIRAMAADGREDLKTLPIIAISANSQESDIQTSMESGMNAHLGKPTDPEALLESVHAFLEGHQKTFITRKPRQL